MGFNILKIKALLKEKKITQKDFAERIDVTSQTVINYFNGRSKIDVYTLEKIAKVLDVEVSYFFNGVQETNILNEPLPKYEKKRLFLEERIEDLENQILLINKKLDL